MSDDATVDGCHSVAPHESCAACGFDSDLYDRADTISSQLVIPAVLGAAAEGLEQAVLTARPNASSWSIVEYVDHVGEVVSGSRMAVASALTDPGIDLEAPAPVEISSKPKQLDLDAALARTATEYRLMEELLEGLTDEQWRIPITSGGDQRTVGWFARHVLHDGLHHLGDIGRTRRHFGRGSSPRTGAVVGLHVSDGGIPKRFVDSVRVEPSGVVGDRQGDRRHHGRPVQAVCLWGADVLAVLQAEGHPIHAGSAGENITVAEVVWSDLRPGTRIDVGSVPMLISAHAIPCAKNAQWFKGRDFTRILHALHPGSSRLYAIPLRAGEVSIGDAVIVEPPTSRRTGCGPSPWRLGNGIAVSVKAPRPGWIMPLRGGLDDTVRSALQARE